MLTTQEVDRSMKDKDTIYSTVFYVWIKTQTTFCTLLTISDI
jgi:hypothetical protein